MYELDDYVAMVEDAVRTPAYAAAIAAVVRPGDVVLELGTGFGFFAVLAARAGAGHVFAVEPNDAIAHARGLARANGVEDRITFVQGRTSALRLERRADVLIEDLRGVSPLHGDRLRVLGDAWDRLLAPAARALPARDVLLVAPAELPADLPTLGAPAARAVQGVEVGSVRAALSQAIHRTRAGHADLLAPGAAWATLEYAQGPVADPAGAVTFTASRDGLLAGFVSWFDAELAPGIGFSTGPAVGRTVYDRGFLPIGAPVPVRAGDRVTVDVRTVFDGTEPVWVWETVVDAATGRVSRRDSNLGTRALSAARRARRAAEHVPDRTAAVAALGRLAALVDGRRTLGEIAERLAAGASGAGGAEAAHADTRDAHAALRWAGGLLARLDEDAGA